MAKSFLALCAAVAALSASNFAFAQSDSPGESKAAPSAPATAAEKKAAKQKRHAVSKEMAAKGEGTYEDQPMPAGPKTKVSDEEKMKAKAKRKAAGTEESKSGTGHLEDVDTKK